MPEAHGASSGKNGQVRAVRGEKPEMSAPGSYLPGAAPGYETPSPR
ncbi:hypothetical protein ACWCQM_29005 [Streptomyces sp. NPDC002125]